MTRRKLNGYEARLRDTMMKAAAMRRRVAVAAVVLALAEVRA